MNQREATIKAFKVIIEEIEDMLDGGRREPGPNGENHYKNRTDRDMVEDEIRIVLRDLKKRLAMTSGEGKWPA